MYMSNMYGHTGVHNTDGYTDIWNDPNCIVIKNCLKKSFATAISSWIPDIQ